ncbi:ArdC family protein [Xenophilus azovorans]|uniref:ArdC family protein n=1 Tax=Xenophilus azovorans TaxID=151755 RepID=UPI00056DAE14|nr:zincin-like metallopeptidase domain-containing protein [Xenophilus azovorans]
MDVRQVITDRIIGMLEKGGNVFRERWTRAAARGVARNGKTGEPYHGANVLLLWDEAIEQGYGSNVWMTYKQAAGLGAQVRRGEKAVLCAHFERRPVKGRDQGDVDRSAADGEDRTEEGGQRGVLLCRPFWVFNVAQIDGLPLELIDGHCYPPGPSCPSVEAALRLVAGSCAEIRHGFERAMYMPELDEIRLPWPRRFSGPEAYCATTLHELVHWTGHASRLNRQFGRRFGDAAYAFEELVAELGSAFVLGHCGLVDATIEGHAAYLDSWLQVLKNDRTAIFTAARHAGAAFEFILSKGLPEGDRSPELPIQA